MKILIAEDELTTRMMVQVSLERWGYDVLDAKNGDEAVALFDRGEQPRIVILDWEMPGLDGLEVCEKLKDETFEQPPYIIMLTARDNQKDIIDGFNAGADDYITKPFSSDELGARVRVAERLVRSQDMLAQSVDELKAVLDQLAMMEGSVVVCEECHKIEPAEDGPWQDYPQLIAEKDSRFTTTICPDCEKP